ncbi:GNAT family N-acetyltransferase [Actinophytocola sediminis]
MRFRTAGQDDALAVAALHADSWQRHYRGAYTDEFLDDEVPGFLTTLWAERLATASPHTVLAECDGELVGFAHTMLDASPAWGALLDNLHVRSTRKRQGLGGQLLAETARAVQRSRPTSGLYLWVLEQNSAARTFYAARGGESVEHADAPAPGGRPARLNGKPRCLRIVWRAPLAMP